MDLLPAVSGTPTPTLTDSPFSSASSGALSSTSAWFPEEIITIAPTGFVSSNAPTRTASSFTSSTSSPACALCQDIVLAHSGSGGILKARSVGDDDGGNDSEGFIQKRGTSGRTYRTGTIGAYGGDGLATIEVCRTNVFSFNAGPYPSTSSGQASNEENPDDDGEDRVVVDGNPESAPNMVGIGVLDGLGDGGVYIDKKVVFGQQTIACPVELWAYGSRVAGSSYHTEHVFELHIVKDFFMWLVYMEHISCKTLEDSFGVDMGEMDGFGSIANEVMLRLSWYNPIYQGTTAVGALMHLEEFFVLEAGLNRLKGKIMNGRPLTQAEGNSLDGLLNTPESWHACIKTFDDIALVMSYLNQQRVMAAWSSPAQRVYEFMAGDVANGFPGGAFFAPLWRTFIRLWLQKRQSDLAAWYGAQLPRCRQLYAFHLQVNAPACPDPGAESAQFAALRWGEDKFLFPSFAALHPGWPIQG